MGFFLWIIVLLKLLKQHVAPVATPQLSLIGLENLGEKIYPSGQEKHHHVQLPKLEES